MPRDIGTGIYTYPSGTPGVPSQTIFSSRYNTFIDDLASTLNQPLPINMGGTGGSTAAVARDNLDAERSMQQVTNYGTHPFENGSFYSDVVATGGPIAGHAFVGTALTGSGESVIYAYDLSVGNTPPMAYTRRQTGGSWGGWSNGLTTNDILVQNNDPNITLDATATGTSVDIVGSRISKTRWNIQLGDITAETGSNAGSDFRIGRFNDAGAFIDTPLLINRATGNATISGAAAIGGATTIGGAATISGSTTINGGTISLKSQPAGDSRLYLFDEAGVEKASLYWGRGFNEVVLRHANTSSLQLTSDFKFNCNVGAYKPGGGVWGDTSDLRIKNVMGDYTSGLEQVLALNPVRFTYRGNDTPAPPDQGKSTPYQTSTHYPAATAAKEFIGLVAQQVEGVMPEMVTQGTGYIDGQPVSDLRSLDTTALIYALVNSVKELSARIEALEAA